MLAQVGSEAGTQKGLGVLVELRAVTEHLREGLDRLDDGAAGGTQITTLAFDRNHPRHVGVDVHEESKIQAVLGDVEGALTQFVEG